MVLVVSTFDFQSIIQVLFFVTLLATNLSHP